MRLSELEDIVSFNNKSIVICLVGLGIAIIMLGRRVDLLEEQLEELQSGNTGITADGKKSERARSRSKEHKSD
jgi:hypothetical protein